MCSCECMSVCAPTFLSVCLCDCCCKCVYARFACVCACMHTITTVDDAWVGVICHNMAKQDVSNVNNIFRSVYQPGHNLRAFEIGECEEFRHSYHGEY